MPFLVIDPDVEPIHVDRTPGRVDDERTAGLILLTRSPDDLETSTSVELEHVRLEATLLKASAGYIDAVRCRTHLPDAVRIREARRREGDPSGVDLILLPRGAFQTHDHANVDVTEASTYARPSEDGSVELNVGQPRKRVGSDSLEAQELAIKRGEFLLDDDGVGDPHEGGPKSNETICAESPQMYCRIVLRQVRGDRARSPQLHRR